MKKMQTLSAALAVAWVSTAQAAGGLYLGASVGLMDADVGGFDNATNVGALLGYEFLNMGLVFVSVETEFTTTIADGDVDLRGQQGHWDIDSQAIYLGVRVGDVLYAKARYGLSRVDVSVEADGGSVSDSDSGGSWGASFGWNFTDRWGLELGGVVVDSDVDYWNFGVCYRF